MSPPRGWKKKKEEEEKKPEEKTPEKPKITVCKKKPPATKPVQDDREYAQIVISWIDDRGRARTTRYTMADLNVNENISEEFNGPKKKTRISLSIDGNVLEKL